MRPTAVLRPLKRIEPPSTALRRARFAAAKRGRRRVPREFAALESKLNLLGQKYSGAKDITKQRPSLDDKLERMATNWTWRRAWPPSAASAAAWRTKSRIR